MAHQARIDIAYLKMAREWSKLSVAERKKVGCLIVKDSQIISDGFNGTPSGFPNECEDVNGKTLRHVLHAESNAITKLAKSTNSSVGSTLYTTLSPCFECSKLIVQSGIKKVIYCEEYREKEGPRLLERAGVEVKEVKLIDGDVEP